MGLNLVLLGPPGAGKGVQSAKIARHYGLAHVSVGDLLRAHVAADTVVGKAVDPYLGRGELVPDDVVLRLVLQRISEPDAEEGFVLDGVPRTLVQALALDDLLHKLGKPISLALLLKVPDCVIVDRLSGRLYCPDCGAVFHAVHRPPIPGNICPACRTVLRLVGDGRIQCEACSSPIRPREDDRPEIVLARLAQYRREIVPVIEYYESKGLLREIDAAGDEDEVFRRIARLIDSYAQDRGDGHGARS